MPVYDRRPDNLTNESTVNRGKFMDRYKKQIREAVKDAVTNRGGTIDNTADGISIPKRDLSEPVFHTGKGGNRNIIHPGNDQFTKGDLIKRPDGGGGGGAGEGEASDSGEGEDEFVFQISKDEYLDILFEDLELPNMEETIEAETEETRTVRSGFADDGSPQHLDVTRTAIKGISGKIAAGAHRTRTAAEASKSALHYLQAMHNKEEEKILETHKLDLEIKSGALGTFFESYSDAELEENIAEIESFAMAHKVLNLCEDVLKLTSRAVKKRNSLLEEFTSLTDDVQRLYTVKKSVSTLDENLHGRYRNFTEKPVPSDQAVMFCLMDVSGSMDQATKDLAKRFYILLYLFLSRTYKKGVEVVYIRHHTQAKEVDEQEFFYGRETGGTIVSSALKLMNEIIKERFPPSEWNLYGAQASDGDNWGDDSPHCVELLKQAFALPLRYYVYVEITQRNHQSLWRQYTTLFENYADRFCMIHIEDASDIYPEFRKAFKKKASA